VELDTAKQVRVITPGCSIQAVFNYGKGVIVAMETDDC
jgi:L-fucose isomerase-like protein